MKHVLVILLLSIVHSFTSVAQINAGYSVLVNTVVQENPPAIAFSWEEDLSAEFYQIYKREKNVSYWGSPIAVLENSATQFIDYNIQSGEAFEYGFFKTTFMVMDTVPVTPGTDLTFTINDSWGDGICCRLGCGYYIVFSNDSIFAMGGEFSFSKTTSFVIPSYYPTDTRLTVKIYLDNYPEETTWTLTENNSGSSLASGGPYETHKFTCLFAGINYPAVESRGTVLLIVDNANEQELHIELERLKVDLIGDGWNVKRLDVDRDDPVTNIKTLIVNECNNDSTINSLFLIGHIPVPYSGEIAMDGHSDHLGAWPADVYYGELDGEWTDLYVNNTSASRPENHNIPGDGKFDQSNIPSDVDLQVGRVDLFNLPAFTDSDTELLKRYLDKNHAFRHGLIEVERRGLIDESLPHTHHAVGWRNFSSLLGASNIEAVDYLPTLENETFLWSYGCGGSSYTHCGGVASTNDFATKKIKSVFTILFGSYFGDWDNQNNVLRSPLASSGFLLANMWACVPHWYLHHLGMGETIGYSTRVSQNNSTEYVAFWGNRAVHTALMGDPTLRMHVVKPVSELTIDSTYFSKIELSWLVPEDSIIGYYIYRSDNLNNQFTRINQEPVQEAFYTDNTPLSGNNVYMVRAIKLEASGSGTYYNLSQGIFDSIYLTTVGINNNQIDNPEINIFPNPADNLINIVFEKSSNQCLIIELINLQGTLVFRKSIMPQFFPHIEKIDVGGFPSGIYFIRISDNNSAIIRKIIIENHEKTHVRASLPGGINDHIFQKYNRKNKLWQPNYHDHIIRNNDEYWPIKNYIKNNPKNWSDDTFHKT